MFKFQSISPNNKIIGVKSERYYTIGQAINIYFLLYGVITGRKMILTIEGCKTVPTLSNKVLKFKQKCQIKKLKEFKARAIALYAKIKYSILLIRRYCGEANDFYI